MLIPRIVQEDRYQYKIENIRIENVLHRKYCVFDLEGTGPDEKHDHITQIGAIFVENGEIDYSRTFVSLVKSPKPIPPEIEKFTNITSLDLESAPTFKEVMRDFFDFIGDDAILVAQCGFEYDYHLLGNELIRNEMMGVQFVEMDTKVLFAAIHPEIKAAYSTDFLLRFYNIDSDDVPRHNALGDSVLVARILCSILKEYKQHQIQDLNVDRELLIQKYIRTPLS